MYGELDMKAIKSIIEQLDEKKCRVISFLFNPGARPEESLIVPISYVSLVPILEAIGAQLKVRQEQAFNASGEIVNSDALLDMNGMLIFLCDYVSTARRAGHKIRAMSAMNLVQAIDEMVILVNKVV